MTVFLVFSPLAKGMVVLTGDMILQVKCKLDGPLSALTGLVAHFGDHVIRITPHLGVIRGYSG